MDAPSVLIGLTTGYLVWTAGKTLVMTPSFFPTPAATTIEEFVNDGRPYAIKRSIDETRLFRPYIYQLSSEENPKVGRFRGWEFRRTNYLYYVESFAKDGVDAESFKRFNQTVEKETYERGTRVVHTDVAFHLVGKAKEKGFSSFIPGLDDLIAKASFSTRVPFSTIHMYKKLNEPQES